MKCIDAALATDREAVARFQREAQVASLVESEHIVEIFDSGTAEDGRPYRSWRSCAVRTCASSCGASGACRRRGGRLCGRYQGAA